MTHPHTTNEAAQSLAQRAQQLIDAGYKPVPLNGKQIAYAGDTPERDYNPKQFQEGMRIQVRAGDQSNGINLYGFDLEGPSHGTQYDADREYEALKAALPRIANKLRRVRSTSGDGWWLLFRAYKTLHSSQLFDGARKIGDFIGIGGTQRVPDPGDEPLAILTLTEIELLQTFWTFNHSGHTDDPRHWTNRATEGKRYVAGYTRHAITRPMLRTFLRQHGGKTGADLESLFSEVGGFDRSAAAGNLMQCLMFNIHKIAPRASYSEKCALAYAYWLAADSYGKAADKDYNQQKDGCALLAAILHEDRMQNGGQWRAPLWAKVHPTLKLQPEPEAAPAPRAAHRPIGSQARQIQRLRHRIELLAFESSEKVYYNVDDWAEYLGVTRRSVQNYLAAIPGIERGQEGGRGGRAYLILFPAFWGENKSQKAAEIEAKNACSRGENETAVLGTQKPEIAENTPQCKGDHQNLCAPTQPGIDEPAYTHAAAPLGAHSSGDLPQGTTLQTSTTQIEQHTEPLAQSLPPGARIVRPTDGPYCWVYLDNRTGSTHLRDVPDAVLIDDAWQLVAQQAGEWDQTIAWLESEEGRNLQAKCAARYGAQQSKNRAVHHEKANELLPSVSQPSKPKPIACEPIRYIPQSEIYLDNQSELAVCQPWKVKQRTYK